MRLILSLAVLCLLFPSVAYGQAEHVPANNYVYDFLDRMQRNGIVPSFSRAVLPLERKEVTALIDTVYMKQHLLSAAERDLAARFYDEFVREAKGTQTSAVLFDGSNSLSGDVVNDNEKFLYKYMSEDRSTTLFAEFLASAEYRAMFSGKRRSNVTLANIGGRFRGTIGGIVGYGLSSTNGTSFGNRDLALQDRRLRQNFNFTQYNEDFFDFTEAYIAGSWEWGNISLGKELSLYGNSPYFPTIVSENPPSFDAVKFNVHYGDFRFSFMHGFLLSERTFTEENRPFFEPKYISVHRAEVTLFDELRLGVFESVVYAERGVELAYLNPVNFYKSAEHASGDRDNPMLGFDAQYRPFNGWEVYGSWTLDDVDFSRWGADWWGNKFIWQGGLITSTFVPDTDIGIEYTRIEPYVYSHFFTNTTYTNNGYIIGAGLPPNSDQWLASVTWWLTGKVRMRGSFQFRRHGENVYDADGNLLTNHGGDPAYTNVRERDSQTAPFLDGPRRNESLAGLHMRFEPMRNYILEFHYLYSVTGRETMETDLEQHFATAVLRIEY